MLALRIVLLAVAVAGAVARPRGMPAWAAPLVCIAIAFATSATTGNGAEHALRPLVGALGFLLASVPLAVLLERAGVFSAAARRFGDGRMLVPGLWVLAAATTAVLNLDASVVLLTPLYVRIARQTDRPAWHLGAQPLVLSLLASSFLAVSNLTNLIVGGRLGLGEMQFLERLGPPSLLATVAGYFLYRRWAAGRGAPAGPAPAGSPPPLGADDRRSLRLGGMVLVLLLVGFLAGPSLGVQPWEVALGVDVLLAARARQVPLRSIPLGTALVAASLAVLAAALAAGISLQPLFAGRGALGMFRTMGAAAAAANVVNNLPALLVGLPFVEHHPDQLWAFLLAVNMGPSLLVTGTLASLLWHDTMAAVGSPTGAAEIFRLGLRVTLPAAVLAGCLLVALAPLYGGS